MRKVIIFGIFVIVLLIGGCVSQDYTKENNSDKLLNLLGEDQRGSYEAEYRYSGCSSGGSCWNDDYDITVKEEIITKGPSNGLTASNIKTKVKNQIFSMNEKDKKSIIKIKLANEKNCFFGTSFYVCFDQDNNLVYYLEPAYGGSQTWIIPSLFSDVEVSEFDTKLSEAESIQVKNQKIEECSNDVCKKFFTFLSQSSEKQYKIHYEYILKDKNSKWDINEVSEFEVVPGKSVENSEEDLKNQLSSLKVSCAFKEESKNGLICFNLIKEHGTYDCDLYPAPNGRFANECSYCFSNSYLKSVECSGDSMYKEETEYYKRYYKWIKVQ